MDDKQIIAELKKGNEHYLKYLYAHLDMVKHWVLRNNGGEEEAKDLFQEAIVVFYKNLTQGRYEHRAKISTYLFEICKRNWLTFLKRKAGKRESLGEDQYQKMKTDAFEVELDTDRPSLSSYLGEALDKLGEPCRSLIKATVFLKKKMEAVAREFGYADAGSARQQKLRCMKRLRGMVSYDVVMQLA